MIIYLKVRSVKIMGFQRELAPFGRGLGGNAPESPLASGEILTSPVGVLRSASKR